MSFHDTSVRRLALIRACGCFVLAVVLGLLPLLYQVDSLGQVFLVGLAGLAAFLGLINVWKWRYQAPDVFVTIIPERASASRQIQHIRSTLCLTLLAFPCATAWVAYSLSALERGESQSVSVWVPIAIVYQSWGYWPAVASVPAAGLICVVVLVRKLRVIQSTPAHHQPSVPFVFDPDN